MTTPDSPSPWTPPSPSALAPEFPKLEVQSLLAQGGMSAVYLVRQEELERLAVLKVLPPEAALDAETVERFRGEARLLAGLRDPGIMQVYESGTSPGGYRYLLLEHEAGGDLRQWLRGRTTPLSSGELLPIGAALAAALGEAHRRGIVHGDIKLDNIFHDAQTGRFKLGDFGLAGFNGSSEATHHTPGYTAPEILAGHRVLTPQSDVYSLAATLYEMLLGEPPPADAGLRRARLHALPAAVGEVIAAALENDPARRPANGDVLSARLQTAAAKLAAPAAAVALTVVPQAPVRRAAPRAVRVVGAARPAPARRKSNTGLIAAAVVVVAGIVAAVLLNNSGDPAPRIAEETSEVQQPLAEEGAQTAVVHTPAPPPVPEPVPSPEPKYKEQTTVAGNETAERFAD
jgi:eukaryotic-like serine/threonine-protein kinase